MVCCLQAVIPDVDYGKLKTEIENQLRLVNLQATLATNRLLRLLRLLRVVWSKGCAILPHQDYATVGDTAGQALLEIPTACLYPFFSFFFLFVAFNLIAIASKLEASSY